MPKRWIFRGEGRRPLLAAGAAGRWAEELGVSRLLVDILLSRGVSDLAAMDRFLSPGLRHLPQPTDVPGLAEAADVLAAGIAQGLPLAVWGDYDVDGVTATALCVDFLARRGVAVRPYLPHREREGYGLNEAGMEALAAEGVRLLLTVDCGITNAAAVRRAGELGITVVVSDHHLPGEELPPAAAVCDPRCAECGGLGDLAGVGVAFMLMSRLNHLLPGNPVDVRSLLDLVALGTIADVVRLTGYNRILVKNGLLLVKEAKRPGVAALKEASGFDRYAELGAGQIAFGLAPRINAAGRLGDAATALRMLLAPDIETALPDARKIDRMNTDRRKQEEDILAEALEQAQAQLLETPGDGAERMGLVLCADHWHPGIIGIVASRVVERFRRPTLMLCAQDGLLKGSGRSVADFDLHAGLRAVADLLSGYGGHRLAAGLRLPPENLEALRTAFDNEVRRVLGPAPLPPCLTLDAELSLDRVDYRLMKEVELLQPFGMGNPEPLFASGPLLVRSRRVFGKKHVRLDLHDPAARLTLPGKAWRMAEDLGADLVGQTCRVAFTPRIDDYSGVARIELNVRDWQCLRGDPTPPPPGEPKVSPRPGSNAGDC